MDGDHFEVDNDPFKVSGDHFKVDGDHFKLGGYHFKVDDDYFEVDGDHFQVISVRSPPDLDDSKSFYHCSTLELDFHSAKDVFTYSFNKYT